MTRHVSRQRWSFWPFAWLVALAIALSVANGAARAANSGDLDQCANGPLSAPVSCSGSNWQNGNLNANQAHYLEGQFVPYRLTMTGLATGSSNPHTVTIEWDTTKSGKHALDYLGSYNATESLGNNPCSGVTGCSLSFSDTEPIPADSNVTNGPNGVPAGGDDITQTPGVFTLFGGTLGQVSITAVSAYTLSGTYAGDSSTRVTVSFTTDVSNPVLAWGGHIARRVDWGSGMAAVDIPGSPFHMRFIDLDGSGGNQDRGLASEAVIFPATITISKVAEPNDPTQAFPFTATSPSGAGTGIATSFTLTGTSSTTFSGITKFGTYTVTEGAVTGWTLTGLTCDEDKTTDSTTNVSTRTATIGLQEGENVTCTFTNTKQKVTPTVVTEIHEDGGHTATTSVDAGSTVHDKVTVSGSFGTPSGTVDFTFFTSGDCTTGGSTQNNVALVAGTAESSSTAALAAGSYSYQAHYDGDTNYSATDSACEPLIATPGEAGFMTGGGRVKVTNPDGSTTFVTVGGNASGTVGGSDGRGHFNVLNHTLKVHYEGDVPPNGILFVDTTNQIMTFCFTAQDGSKIIVTWDDNGEPGNVSAGAPNPDELTLRRDASSCSVSAPILWYVNSVDVFNGNFQWHPQGRP